MNPATSITSPPSVRTTIIRRLVPLVLSRLSRARIISGKTANVTQYPMTMPAVFGKTPIAAIDMFMGKLRENNGDIWAAVKHYGEGTDEYVAGVRAIYDSIGGDGTNLAPTSTASVGSTIYKSPFLPDAYKKLSEYQKLKIAKIRKDEADRYAKVQWEMGITADEAGIADDGDDRAWAIDGSI